MKRGLLFLLLMIGMALPPAAALYAETAAVEPGERSEGVSKEDNGSFDADMEDDVFDEFSDDQFESHAAAKPKDPLRVWNRAMFHFNDKFYFWFLKPAARGYRFIVPNAIRTGIKNVFDNLEFPVRFVNSILQGKGRKTQIEFARFALNTTIGIGGIFNPAAHFPELRADDEDLGQTLGTWGIGNGWYVVWPFLGPSTLRDTVGLVGDGFLLDPLDFVEPFEAYLGLKALEILNATSFRIGDYESLKGSSFEPYEAFQGFYLQHREKKMRQ